MIVKRILANSLSIINAFTYMALIIVFAIMLVVLMLAVRTAVKNRNKGESKFTLNEHPSTFKKPTIEMVTNPPEKKEQPKTSGKENLN